MMPRQNIMRIRRHISAYENWHIRQLCLLRINNTFIRLRGQLHSYKSWRVILSSGDMVSYGIQTHIKKCTRVVQNLKLVKKNVLHVFTLKQ